MLEAVIWDFGGVLTSSPFEAFARFETERGLPPGIIRRTNAANHLENAWAKFERAEVDIEAFDQLFAAESRALGAEVRGRDVLPLLSGYLRPEMVEALRRVKTRLKTGCITNNLPANSIGSAGGRTLYVAEVMALFDQVIESAKIGLRKPDPRIYRMMVDALGVDSLQRRSEAVGVTLAPDFAVGHDIDAGALEVADRDDRRVILGLLEVRWRDAPHLGHAGAGHRFGQHLAIDQPIGLRITSHDGRRQQVFGQRQFLNSRRQNGPFLYCIGIGQTLVSPEPVRHKNAGRP